MNHAPWAWAQRNYVRYESQMAPQNRGRAAAARSSRFAAPPPLDCPVYGGRAAVPRRRRWLPYSLMWFIDDVPLLNYTHTFVAGRKILRAASIRSRAWSTHGVRVQFSVRPADANRAAKQLRSFVATLQFARSVSLVMALLSSAR